MPPHDWQPGPSSSGPAEPADPLGGDDLAQLTDLLTDDATAAEWLTEDDLALLAECARHRGWVDPCTEFPPGFDFAWLGATDPGAAVTTASYRD